MPSPQLPATDQVTRLHLVRIPSSDSGPRLPHPAPGEVVAVWEGDTPRRALALVRDFRPGGAMRCFLPRYALRALADGRALFDLVLCYRCQRLLIRDGTVTTYFDFDSRHAAAVELRYERGWSVRDTADFLGVAPGLLGQILFRARVVLRAALEESGARVSGLLVPA